MLNPRVPIFRLIGLVAIVLLSSGFRCWILCADQTGIQNDYVSQRDECGDEAQDKIDDAEKAGGAPLDEKTRKNKLATLFSDCMAENGWTVLDNKSGGKTPTPAAPIIGPAMANPAPNLDGLSGSHPAPAELTRPAPHVPTPAPVVVAPVPIVIAPALPAPPAPAAPPPAAAPVAPAPAPAPAPADSAATTQQDKAYEHATECAYARQYAATSNAAAERMKACDAECAQFLKTAPPGFHPAACPQ